MISRIRGWFKKFLLREEGGKNVINKKNMAVLAVGAMSLGIVGSLVPAIFFKEDDSSIKHSDAPLVKSQTPSSRPGPDSSPGLGGVGSHGSQKPPKGSSRGIVVKYKAKQVITPSEGADQISIGTSFIGKLLTGIDTRSPQTVQVTLPYGGSDKNGNGAFPPATILFGQVNYPGHDERVYLTFDHGLLPDGQEITLQARGLSSKDYAPGIIGDFHSNTGSQMASVVGLSMVSGMSEIMVEKEGLGNSFTPTPKATLKNGVYNGLSKVTEMQANRQAEKLAQIPDYVSVSEGSDVIISLTGSYHSGNGK